MRTSVMLHAMFALAAISMVGQIATGIHLVEVRFNGDTRLDGVDLKKCAADLKSRIYEGPQWADSLLEHVRVQCLQDKGYFKAAVEVSTHQLPDREDTHQFVIAFDINAGLQYRLGHITFRNNRAIYAKALRKLFPVKDGDILDPRAIAQGLDNLRYVYGEMGYINFTSIPGTTFDDEKKLGFLEINEDEGKQFFVSGIDIVGADAQVLNDLALKPGQIYNVRLVDLFLRKHLPGADVNDPHIQQRVLNEREGTVALTFDFRSRPTTK